MIEAKTTTVRFAMDPEITHAFGPVGVFRGGATLCGTGGELMGRMTEDVLPAEVSCPHCCRVGGIVSEFSFAPPERQVESTAVLF